MSTESNKLMTEGVTVSNAGLVLLNGYYLVLMERLGEVTDKAFKTEDDQLNAVQYIQYIAVGAKKPDDSLLALNKVLCGLSPDTPVNDWINMTENQKKTIEEMIEAVIRDWPAIGDMTISAFRLNWLVREGVLKESKDYWELNVEKRVYDLLLNKSPLSFSIINLPWMQKPLQVNWPN